MAQRNVRGYITYAKGLLEEKGHSTIELRAMGRAIHKAVLVGGSWVGLACDGTALERGNTQRSRGYRRRCL
jgi:hypothetical protein